MADNARKELTMLWPGLNRVNKEDSTAEEKEEFARELRDRLAEREREAREREEAERQRLAEEGQPQD